MTRIRVQARLRATPAPNSGGGGGGPLAGPYLTQYLQPFPTGDGVTYVFGIHGLAETDVVAWSVTLGEFDFVPQEILDAHTLVVVYQGGDGGSVTATVNGELLGSIAYGAP
jgi:hypothetical protein